ncbi:MAG: hypothetical protein FJW29_10585 [Acidobacteria bacterium]|nr:hypothetical protein [Acidobacteriota bacterium]
MPAAAQTPASSAVPTEAAASRAAVRHEAPASQASASPPSSVADAASVAPQSLARPAPGPVSASAAAQQAPAPRVPATPRWPLPVQGVPTGPGLGASVLPAWLQVHAEQRTRYETMDTRYRPGETGSDQQLDFRTRLQVRVGGRAGWIYSEVQDARVALDDSGSTVTPAQENFTKVLQAFVGRAWQDVGRGRWSFQAEAGRFSRDFGFRRVIARNIYRNTTNAYDGAIVRAGRGSWAVQALAVRPVFYTWPDVQRDRLFDRTALTGLYVTSTARRAANLDVYALAWRDGRAMPERTRRVIDTGGARVFGTFGRDGRAEYEVEAAAQRGQVGPLLHRAWFQHSQVGYNWPSVAWKPRVLVFSDYATGTDPTSGRSGAWDALLGARRFEFAPVGLYNLLGRANLNSPGVWLQTRPRGHIDLWVQLRGVWLANARDRWRPVGLVDPTGSAGWHVGTQTEYRLRYRIGWRIEIDSGVVHLVEGRFLRQLGPGHRGRALFFYSGVEFRY